MTFQAYAASTGKHAASPTTAYKHKFVRRGSELIAPWFAMDLLVRTSLWTRLAVRRGTGVAFAGALAATRALVPGSYRVSLWPTFGSLGLVWVFMVARALRARFGRASARPEGLIELELGMLFAVGLDAERLRVDDSLSGAFSPATYILVAVIAALAHPAATVAVTLWVIGLDATLRFAQLGIAPGPALAVRAGFMVAFAVLNLTFLRAEVARTRMTARAKVEAELTRLKEDARRYRLL